VKPAPRPVALTNKEKSMTVQRSLLNATWLSMVLRSYQYVAMFNVSNKFALDAENPMNSGGYNRVKANTELADHTVQAIARPNNDTLTCLYLADLVHKG
jgi:hypothetical protein